MNNPSFQNKTLPEHSDEPLSFGGAATLRDAPASKAGRFRIGDSVLGRYTIMGELGQGGMGVVYKCLDTIGGIRNMGLRLARDLK